MKKLLLGTASLMIAASAPMAAQAGDISVSTSIDYVSEYVFRGVSFARGAVQPGIEVSKGDFTVGVWTSAAIGEASVVAGDEIDVYASYGFELSDSISASVGATIYHFPDVPGSLFDFGDASSLEFNAGVSFDTPLAPSVTAYYDVDLEAFTLEGGVGHSVPVGEKTSLDLGLTAGLVAADGGGDYEYGQASASLGYGFTDDVSAYIGANYSLSSIDSLNFRRFEDVTTTPATPFSATTSDNLLWFGVGVAAGF